MLCLFFFLFFCLLRFVFERVEKRTNGGWGWHFVSVFSMKSFDTFVRGWLLCSLLDVKESLSNVVYCCCCLCCYRLNVAKKNRDFFKSHIRFDRTRCSGTRRRCARWRCSPHRLWWTPPDREYPTTPTSPIVRASILEFSSNPNLPFRRS